MKDLTKSRETPIDHEYESCDETRTTLRIYPKRLSHEEITALLRVQPSEAHNAGDQIPTIKGTMRTAGITYWLLSSEDHVSSKDMRAHLDWLIGQLEPAAEQLRQLQSSPGIKMSVSCVWWSRYGGGGPTLWPEQMRKLAEFNLECGFDFAFYGEDEEREAGSTPCR